MRFLLSSPGGFSVAPMAGRLAGSRPHGTGELIGGSRLVGVTDPGAFPRLCRLHKLLHCQGHLEPWLEEHPEVIGVFAELANSRAKARGSAVVGLA